MTEPIVVRVNKADGGPEAVAGAIIFVVREQPTYNYRDDLAVIDAQFTADAEAIEDALIHSLPGGTYDRLLGLMLARKASHFRVSHFVSEVTK